MVSNLGDLLRSGRAEDHATRSEATATIREQETGSVEESASVRLSVLRAGSCVTWVPDSSYSSRMDSPPDPKKRRVHAPHSRNSRGGVTARTLDDIHSVLEEHARQIEMLAAANKMLKDRNTALEERWKALDRKSESLERSCDKLEVRCSSLERSIQVLKKDVNWAYSAPSIPRSQGIVLGRDEDYANSMGGAIRHIKKD
ncbi:hypothetical protein THAOC_26542, partial [Thalassiosira oceanica]